MAKSSDKSNIVPYTYTSTEVDRQNAESFIDGYAHCNGVVYESMEKTLRAIDSVMGLYLEDDLGAYNDRVKELGLAYNTIRHIKSEFESAYDVEMNNLKSLYKLDGYVANID